ncbi:polysaccharide ABC transporter ATP-binding protein [Pseudomonas otitidis]|uniref:ABC transporter ATP-binding protein n=1 Tax=Metapseudomonas otitidis TaxID=319939 RepID=UPI00244D1050|nr:polysaccharide ABC transporter ATP-binding protein [Pseudomonas otitidis]MDH1109246.1 polysaccharide ABC transporter ATP-binding protein [Pseudomonas otitidis]MDH1159986.1 polysaccharide ABC transporter ATP-binding protein [Pseudomonas otitidis]MDH1167406.1 polysaccharide ABC transporter ATP-binding protein [Pseudomonas otitidis]
MSDVIIRAEGLSKLYKLYAKPHYRFLDMLGLLRRVDAYQEHWAIRDLNLTIRKGEKVAFIGRNGAGKSTLLRLITGVTQPTEGRFEVSQGAHALLQIGTGFHPDFTGRENALAYLAHLAVTGERANQKVEEIIAFSELEEYIDQPVKTYSSGMMARLMFATSTAISPELLVLDEILGVGDAYFANKSFERIREMAEESGTTVLLVSHDVYSAAKLCDRMIWMDRGSVLLDGRSDEVIRAYEHSVRLQEEARLRAKAISTRKAGICLLELSSVGQAPLQGQLLVRAVRLFDGERLLGEYLMRPGDPVFEPSSGFDEVDGQAGLRMMADGGAIKRCRLVLDLSRQQVLGSALTVEIDYVAGANNRLLCELWFKDKCELRSELELAAEPSSWSRARSGLLPPETQLAKQSDVHGSGRIWLEDIELCGEDGQARFVFDAGEAISVLCSYRTEQRSSPLPVEFLFAFHRDGVTDIARLSAGNVSVAPGCGRLRFEWSGLKLGLGTYTFTVFAVRPGYFEENDGKFYSINDDVYFAFNRGLEITIKGNGGKLAGASTLLPMCVTVSSTCPESA